MMLEVDSMKDLIETTWGGGDSGWMWETTILLVPGSIKCAKVASR